MALASRQVVGQFNSQNYDDSIKVDSFGTLIQKIMPNGTAPLFALTQRFKRTTATDTEHGYWTSTMVFPEFELTANVAANDTVLTVDDTSFLIEGMTFTAHATGEMIIVNQVLSNTSISVSRGANAAAIDIGTQDPEFYQVGNAFEEGSLRPQPQALQPIRLSNYTQIFRNAYQLTGTAAAIKKVVGDDNVSENAAQGAAFHATAIETALIFGVKQQGYRKGQPFRTMGGILEAIRDPNNYPASHGAVNSYVADTAGTDAETLENYLDPCFNQVTDLNEPNRRLIFAGGTAVRALNDIARKNGNYQLTHGMSEWGLRFRTMVLTRGTFDIIEHPLFNTNHHWKKMALVVDPSSFDIAYLGGRDTVDTKFNADGKQSVDNGVDAIGGSLLTECTALVKNPPANAIITNLTKGLADE